MKEFQVEYVLYINVMAEDKDEARQLADGYAVLANDKVGDLGSVDTDALVITELDENGDPAEDEGLWVPDQKG